MTGKLMLFTGQKLLEWACEHDGGLSSFAGSALATSRQLLLPHYKMQVKELWMLERDRLNAIFDNGGKVVGRQVPVHPTILWWSIGFLAKHSQSCYKEVAKVMKLPNISYVFRKMKEMVSRSNDKGYAIHFTTLKTMKERAKEQGWTSHQCTGAIAEDSDSLY